MWRIKTKIVISNIASLGMAICFGFGINYITGSQGLVRWTRIGGGMSFLVSCAVSLIKTPEEERYETDMSIMKHQKDFDAELTKSKSAAMKKISENIQNGDLQGSISRKKFLSSLQK